jgi:hypothetical protein
MRAMRRIDLIAATTKTFFYQLTINFGRYRAGRMNEYRLRLLALKIATGVLLTQK